MRGAGCGGAVGATRGGGAAAHADDTQAARRHHGRTRRDIEEPRYRAPPWLDPGSTRTSNTTRDPEKPSASRVEAKAATCRAARP